MQLILFTSNDKFRSEIYIVIKMLESGLETLHIKKSNFSKKQLIAYINQIPEKFHNRLIIHSHYSLIFKYKLKGIHLSRSFRKKKIHLSILTFLLKKLKSKKIISCSAHSIERLLDLPNFYSYVLLSPIFINNELNTDFNKSTLENVIPQLDFNVYASGGINSLNTNKITHLGFKGIALMGSIWFNDEQQPIEHFKDFNKKLTTLS